MSGSETPAGARAIGLCLTCRHARVLHTPRSTFWHCARAATDPRFDKYPRLPVLRCAGHEPVEAEGTEPDSGA